MARRRTNQLSNRRRVTVTGGSSPQALPVAGFIKGIIKVEAKDWITLVVNAGGAVATCAMFLWYLIRKDKSTSEAMNQQMAYLKDRDQQSKEIAINGHDALKEISEKVTELALEIKSGGACRSV